MKIVRLVLILTALCIATLAYYTGVSMQHALIKNAQISLEEAKDISLPAPRALVSYKQAPLFYASRHYIKNTELEAAERTARQLEETLSLIGIVHHIPSELHAYLLPLVKEYKSYEPIRVEKGDIIYDWAIEDIETDVVQFRNLINQNIEALHYPEEHTSEEYSQRTERSRTRSRRSEDQN